MEKGGESIYFSHHSSRESQGAISAGSPSGASHTEESAERAPACGAARSSSHRPSVSVIGKVCKERFKNKVS